MTFASVKGVTVDSPPGEGLSDTVSFRIVSGKVDRVRRNQTTLFIKWLWPYIILPGKNQTETGNDCGCLISLVEVQKPTQVSPNLSQRYGRRYGKKADFR